MPCVTLQRSTVVFPCEEHGVCRDPRSRDWGSGRDRLSGIGAHVLSNMSTRGRGRRGGTVGGSTRPQPEHQGGPSEERGNDMREILRSLATGVSTLVNNA
ncbi:hypothetical protein M569_12780 [Genlisea aurea]|uniref:Uncharacterized protein n=1 Tax=Genlisea aurea TaxID=192259 RepID=S8DGS5_9LAMI|nr:hypothetical protein M569_12780 [Genlisea aurea]